MQSTTLRTVQVDGFTVRIRTTPGPENPTSPRSPYVLVHGLGMTHRYFDRLRAELAADAVVHAVDLPGYGPSPRPRTHLGVEDHAGLIVEALAALRVGSCTLVGHSMGVQFITAAALRAPALAERVVLIGPVVDRQRRTILQQAVSLGHDTFRESPSANVIVYGDYLRTGLRWYVRQLLPMMQYPLERAVEQLRCPVLVVRGGRDPVARGRWSRELAARARDGVLVEVDGQAHVVQHSAARVVAAQIIAFAVRTPRLRAVVLPQASDGPPGKLEFSSAS
ncbi:alpha/beta fold hydrolase [Arthrobacter agilis]|uniref:alpha/beta fold hydrolase n=1 Tax=Arthrobacter agilis TaxID=37921 RepID=UPI00277EE65E|nr:alpha/beta hydrolase [Arthrobacter agilis]MDQ0736618.1 pimeloyl-ACP methyl ester carboxylesterase [Arthrobacter agilis]